MIIKQSPKIRHIRCFQPIVTIEEVSYYKGIADIYFTSPGTLKKKIDEWVNDNVIQKIHKPPTYRKVNYASNKTVSEVCKFLSGVCKSKPTVVSIIPPYDEKCVPQTMTEIYPKMLFDYCDPLKKNSLDYLELCNPGT